MGKIRSTKTYQAYATRIETDLDLSLVLPAADVLDGSLKLVAQQSSAWESAKLCKLFSTISHGRNLTLSSDREFAPGEPDQPWCFEVDKVVQFFWKGSHKKIEYHMQSEGTDQLLSFWIIHIFLPLYFTIERRYEFLHASAVEIHGHSILFTAPSTGGKSTMTDFFLKHGSVLISDDKVATYMQAGCFFAVPSHPNHRPYRSFEDLGIRVSSFSGQPRPIDAVYCLKRAGPDENVTIIEIKGHQKFARLLPNYLFDFEFTRALRLNYLAEMMSAVPVYLVEVPWKIERLAEVHDAINKQLSIAVF